MSVRKRAWKNAKGGRSVSGQFPANQIKQAITRQHSGQGRSGGSDDFIDTSALDITGQDVRTQTPKPGVGGSSPSTPASEWLNS
jgi:hypothetical protein